jgi:hypothetical protein
MDFNWMSVDALGPEVPVSEMRDQARTAPDADDREAVYSGLVSEGRGTLIVTAH